MNGKVGHRRKTRTRQQQMLYADIGFKQWAKKQKWNKDQVRAGNARLHSMNKEFKG